MKRVVFLFCMIVICSIAWAADKVTVSGSLKGLKEGTKLSLVPGATHKKMEPVANGVVKNGTFSLEVEVSEPRLFYLRADSVRGQVTLLLAPGDRAVLSGVFPKAVVTGSPTTTIYYDKFNKTDSAISKGHNDSREQFVEVSKRMGAARAAKDQAAIKAVEASPEWIAYNEASRKQMEQFMARIEKNTKENYNTYWGPLLIMAHTAYVTGEFEKYYDMLSAEAKDTYYGKLLREELFGLAGTAPNFTAKDEKGNTKKLSEIIDGKHYVLLDFWASWCGPCRRFVPKVKDLAKKYEAKGLKVVSLSIDTDKKAWLKAVEEERMPWPNLLDETGISKAFGVTAIPSIFLIDPQGKIVFGKQSGDLLIQKLKEYFGE